MTKSNSKKRLGCTILVLFILTMALSISITPLIFTEVGLEYIVHENTSERLLSQESIDTPSIREVDSPERITDVSYNYDSLLTNSKEWDVEQPEREPYQSETLDITFGTPHPPIEITSNDDFDTQGWPGDGTPSVPYVIDDLEITATAAVPGISVTGTDVYFVISDCIIDGNLEYSKGIVLNAVENALVYNNTVFQGGIGILLNQTDGISVIENQCFEMTRAGIYLDGSDDNDILRNYITDCWDGIYLEQSSFNSVDENFCAGNQWGIDLYWMSNENDVYNNSVIFNGDKGILLTLECTFNTIELNHLENNGGSGIFLHDSDDNTITENYCENNFGEILLLDTQLNIIDNNTLVTSMGSNGIEITDSHDILLTHNYCYQIEFALVISGTCYGIDIIDNNCTFFDIGLVVDSGNDILIVDNYFNSLGYSNAILAFNTTSLDILDNYCTNAEVLLWIEECAVVNIVNNHCEFYLGGIFNMGTNSSTIEDNLCQHGEDGIISVQSFDLVVNNNTVFDHAVNDGIGIYTSPYSTVTNNNCTSNIVAIHADSSSGVWIEENHCFSYEQGIWIEESNYTSIINNRVEDGFTGILIESSFFADILDNDVFYNIEGPTGIHLFNCESCLISRNNCTGNEVPSIYLEVSHHCEVTQNIITETIDGIVLDGSNYTIVVDNYITLGQGYGIGVWSSSFNYVSGNHVANISGWEGYALICDGIENEFNNNLGANSTVGFYIEDAVDCLISHNTARGNDDAFLLIDSCENVTMTWNIFEDNTQNGEDDSVSAWIEYNYWSNYTGIDANADGIGDTSHPIDGLAINSDLHPLVYYPTLPSWETEPTDQELEYGHSFTYTLGLFTPPMIAPISEWWISDSDFVIDDGVITNDVLLDIGEHLLEVRAYNLYGLYLNGFFTVTVSDTVDPTILGPDDFSYVVGLTGRMITWIPDDLGPASYSLTLDGVIVMSGAWNSTSENITYTADGLSVGAHTFVLTVVDVGGNTATDTVVVTVVASDAMLFLIIAGAGAAIIAVVIIIYMVKKKGAST